MLWKYPSETCSKFHDNDCLVLLTFQKTMTSKVYLLWMVYVIFKAKDLSGANTNIRYLVRVKNSEVINLRCTANHEDISSIFKLINLFGQDGVTGMYKTSKTAAYPCYFNATRSGLVDVNNLSGGQVYLIGKTSSYSILVLSRNM